MNTFNKKITRTEYFNEFKKFIDGQNDIQTFVEICYQDDICNKIYEIRFDEFKKNYGSPSLENFISLGAELYNFLDKLNKRLNIQHFNQHDTLLIKFIAGRIIKEFSDWDAIKKTDLQRLTDLLINNLEKYKAHINLIDSVSKHISDKFKDESVLNVKKVSDSILIVSTKENGENKTSNCSLFQYLNFLMDVRDLTQADIVKKCEISKAYVSNILAVSGGTLPSKNKLFRLSLGLRLEKDEHDSLFNYAREEEYEKYRKKFPDKKEFDEKYHDKYAMDTNDPRDRFILSFIDAARNSHQKSTSKHIIDIINEELRTQDMKEI